VLLGVSRLGIPAAHPLGEFPQWQGKITLRFSERFDVQLVLKEIQNGHPIATE